MFRHQIVSRIFERLKGIEIQKYLGVGQVIRLKEMNNCNRE